MKRFVTAVTSCGHPKALVGELVLWAFLFATDRVGWTCGWKAAQKQLEVETPVAETIPKESRFVQWPDEMTEFERGVMTVVNAGAVIERKRLEQVRE